MSRGLGDVYKRQPLAGAWIEIMYPGDDSYGCVVAPLAGAWIEIKYFGDMALTDERRSPRGSVD